LLSFITMFRSNSKPIFLLIGLVVYIVSPFDLLPEAILGPIGLIDDVGALVMLGTVIKTVFNALLL
jgi:uncharacterized membrane protein YkvA (DUF1232 family)